MRSAEDIICMCNPVLHKYTCGDRSFEYYEASVIARPYVVKATIGEHDYRSCEGCQNNRQKIEDSLKDRERKFPLCCDFYWEKNETEKTNKRFIVYNFLNLRRKKK